MIDYSKCIIIKVYVLIIKIVTNYKGQVSRNVLIIKDRTLEAIIKIFRLFKS